MNTEMQTKIREWEQEPAHPLSSCSRQIPKMD